MSFNDPWRTQGRQLVAALAPGEQVLSFTATGLQASLPPIVVDAPRPPPQVAGARPSRWWLLGGLLAVLDWSPSLPFVDRIVDRLSNVPAQGRVDSHGITLHAALGGVPWDATAYLVVTGERLALFHGRGLDAPLHLVADVPRREVVGAEVRVRLLPPSPGRLRVHFEDQSWIELADALQMGRRRAQQARRALLRDEVSVRGAPGPPPGGPATG